MELSIVVDLLSYRLVSHFTLLSCIGRFLRARQQNKAQSKLLYLCCSVSESHRKLRFNSFLQFDVELFSTVQCTE